MELLKNFKNKEIKKKPKQELVNSGFKKPYKGTIIAHGLLRCTNVSCKCLHNRDVNIMVLKIFLKLLLVFVLVQIDYLIYVEKIIMMMIMMVLMIMTI